MIVILLSISLVLSYLIGSIPFAYLYGKLFKSIDIREHGSGNIGATNMLRVLGTKAGVLVLFLDMLKGFLPVFLAIYFFASYEWFPVLVAIFAVLGHIFTVFLSFKGGRGVATSAGVFLALCPLTLLGAIIIFCIVVALTRYVSLGSIIASISIVFGNFMFEESLYLQLFTIVVAMFIIYKHKSNIKRLIEKTENKFY